MKTETLNYDLELRQWHRPMVTRMSVSLDTTIGGGTNTDGATSDPGNQFPSDRRLKKDVNKINDALTSLFSLNGVTYHYDTANHPEMGLSDKPQIGFIAQELEEVYPQFVVTKENGYKAVSYAPMVAVLVEAIKEQQTMIESLQQQVNKLSQKKEIPQ